MSCWPLLYHGLPLAVPHGPSTVSAKPPICAQGTRNQGGTAPDLGYSSTAVNGSTQTSRPTVSGATCQCHVQRGEARGPHTESTEPQVQVPTLGSLGQLTLPTFPYLRFLVCETEPFWAMRRLLLLSPCPSPAGAEDTAPLSSRFEQAPRATPVLSGFVDRQPAASPWRHALVGISRCKTLTSHLEHFLHLDFCSPQGIICQTHVLQNTGPLHCDLRS